MQHANLPWSQYYGQLPNWDSSSLPYANLTDLVNQSCQKWSGNVAFTTCMPNGMFGSISFAELEQFSNEFAQYLINIAEFQKGDRIAIQMPNCIAYAIAVFGVWKAGLVVVNTNPLYTPKEMAHQFCDSKAEGLVIVDMFTDKLAKIIDRTHIRDVFVASVADFFPTVAGKVVKGVQKYWHRSIPDCNVQHTLFTDALTAGAKAGKGLQEVTINAEDLAMLQYTGGTTGVSKGAMLTHKNLISNVYQIHTLAGESIEQGRECILTALPLYHIFAFTVNLLAFLSKGARNVLIPNPRPISNLQRSLENYPVTWITGVNTLFNALLNEEWFFETPPPSLKVAAAGGAMLHKAVASRWRQVTGTPLIEGYGLTEASPVVTFNPFRDNLTRDESIGIPLPGTNVKIIDESGDQLDYETPGELIVSGPQVMQGYWERPKESSDTLKDGWLYTGDIATMDKDGYFRIVDRKKDLIIVSGFNVYPNEIEDCLALFDGVQEVAVVGIADGNSGERVVAYVVTENKKMTANELIEHCRKNLTGYKVPKEVHFTDELPKSPIGKILRRELRDSMQLKKGA